ncbi:MAG: hypothetical protein CMO55_06820 [Verrucomicrobiales bacterium]|nr:hypothetical protein [Verrucomicrobiales bacterium]
MIIRPNLNKTVPRGGRGSIFALSFAFLAATTGASFAQDEQAPAEETQTLDQIEVESTQPAPAPRPASAPVPAPAPAPAPVVVPAPEPVVISDDIPTSNVITETELELYNPADYRTLFRRTPSVTIDGGRNPIGSKISVYNLNEELLNVSVDGAQQGSINHHRRSTMIEPELLKQVDVVAGAGTALDGFGTLGGAVKFETKNAFDLLSCGLEDYYVPSGKAPLYEGKAPILNDKMPILAQKRFGGYIKGTGFANGDGAKGSGAVYGLINDNWSYLIAGGYEDRDDVEDGNGNIIPDSAYSTEHFLTKISGRSDDGAHQFDLSYEYLGDETFGPYRLNVDPAWFPTGHPAGAVAIGPSDQHTSQRQTVVMNYDFNPEYNDAVNIETNVFWNSVEWDFDGPFARPAGWAAHTEHETVGLDIRNTSSFGEFADLTYGFAYQDRRAFVEYIGTPGARDEYEDVFGFYTQAKLPLNDWWDFTAGARWDHYDFTDVSGQNIESDAVSPNAALTFYPIEDLGFTYGYYESYRGVGIREAYLPSIPAPGTDGETSRTHKVSYNYDNGAFFSRGAFFQQEIENYLYPTAGASFFDIENQGYEFEVGVRKGGFQALVGVFHSEARTPGYLYPDDFGLVNAGRRWVADASYHFENIGVTVGWTTEIREAEREVPSPGPFFPYVNGKDDYTVNSLYMAWNVPNCEGLSATLNVDNIFDEFYNDHSIYGGAYASPGREIRLGLNYRF